MSIQSEKIDLATNAGAGTGTDKPIKGGKYMIMAEATWGGGNVKLQMQAPNSSWFDVASSTLSANGMLPLELPPGRIRAVVTTSTGVYASLVGIPQ